jgi:hypothetical protein
VSRGSEARAALKAECEAAIEDIRRNGHQSGCKAHDALARGQITLLRCEIARLESAERDSWVTRRNAGILGTIAGAAAAAIYEAFKGR